MRHVNMSKTWTFSRDPFPAYRARLVYGATKRDSALLPVKDLEPEEGGILPPGKFLVIRTKQKGTTLIVPGNDKKGDRCLIMVDCFGGFRGGVKLLGELSSANILLVASAASACESGTAVAAILDKGGSLLFRSYGRNTDNVVTFYWDGEEVSHSTMTKVEWDAQKEMSTTDDVETL